MKTGIRAPNTTYTYTNKIQNLTTIYYSLGAVLGGGGSGKPRCATLHLRRPVQPGVPFALRWGSCRSRRGRRLGVCRLRGKKARVQHLLGGGRRRRPERRRHRVLQEEVRAVLPHELRATGGQYHHERRRKWCVSLSRPSVLDLPGQWRGGERRQLPRRQLPGEEGTALHLLVLPHFLSRRLHLSRLEVSECAERVCRASVRSKLNYE